MKNKKVALITGGAIRIGKSMVEYFHAHGYHVCFSYHQSQKEAEELSAKFSQESIASLQCDLRNPESCEDLVVFCLKKFGGIDTVINSASSFFPTPLSSVSLEQWNDLMSTNCLAPLIICKSAEESLTKRQGSIINIIDIHAFNPMPRHIIYNIAKSGLLALTRSLALEMAPRVRVNAIAPGTILMAKHNHDPATQPENILPRIPLKRIGLIEEISQTALFLAKDATYTTGQVICVDGGRHLHI